MIAPILFYTTALLVTITPSVLATPVHELGTIQLPAGFEYPNGIARASDGTLYVGSVSSGKILRITPDGTIETFFPGTDEIFAANSLRLDEERNILWGTSSDFLGVRGTDGQVTRRPHRIFALDPRTAKVLHVIIMPDNGFGNDIALDDSGGVYLTDSARPRIHYLAPGTTQLQIWVEDEQLRTSGQIGPAGIARTQNGILIIGIFSDGKLLRVTPQAQGTPKVETIVLPRSLENPDGMQLAPDGSLLLTEGAITSGNGRLLRIRNILTPEPKLKEIEVLAENLESPVNLTVAGEEIWLTEARIRHRLLPEKKIAMPDHFFIRRFKLQE